MAQPTSSAVISRRHHILMNVKPSVGEDNVLTFELPGWSFGQFTRTGKLGLWNIYKTLEIDRIGLRKVNVEEQISGVIGATKCTISKMLYQTAAISSPMVLSSRYGTAGQTSFTIIVEAKDKNTGNVLAKLERQVVRINPETRQPVQIPERLQKLRTNNPKQNFKVQIIKRPLDRSMYHTYRYKVAASDMDHMYHVNQGIYHKFCLDAAYDAGRVHFLKNFSKDICEYEVKEVSAKHAGEAHAGDQIEVFVWENPQELLCLHFEIRKEDKSIFFSTVHFYALNVSRL